MRKFVLAFVAISVLSGQAFAAEPAAKPATTDEVIANYKKDMQSKRADIMAKNLTLTTEQAAKFWPAYAKFESEQATIVDDQLRAVQNYSEHFKTLSDADSLAYVNTVLDRDLKINQLRKKWLAEFQKFLPAGTAARVIHLDRRLGLAQQMTLASQIPLVH